ncbi:hypothetical protein ACWDYJ_08540 [Streptomyces sp. NPDC003042]
MFIRPVGVTVTAAARPEGRPLLRGLLRRAVGAGAGAGAAGAAGAAEWAVRPEVGGAGAGAGAGVTGAAGRGYAYAREAGPVVEPPGGSTVVAELTQLADLAREGLLTPEEFAAAKALLLRR